MHKVKIYSVVEKFNGSNRAPEPIVLIFALWFDFNFITGSSVIEAMIKLFTIFLSTSIEA